MNEDYYEPTCENCKETYSKGGSVTDDEWNVFYWCENCVRKYSKNCARCGLNFISDMFTHNGESYCYLCARDLKLIK